MSDITAVNTGFFTVASETFEDNLSASIAALAAIVPVTNASEYTNGDWACITVDAGTVAEATFLGQKNGNQFENCKWTEGNTAVGHSLGATVIDYDSATHHNLQSKGIRKFANDDGTLKTQPIRDALGLGTSSTDGYSLFPASMTVTSGYNTGAKEFIVTAANYDARPIVTPGTKLRIQRNIAPPTQAMQFNAASSQYATKASPVGVAPGTTLTLEAWVYLNSYTGTPHIIGRGDNSTGGFAMRLNSVAQLSVYYGTGGNFTDQVSYQSLPLNRWVHIAGVVTSTASKTINVYINGALCPSYAANSTATSLTNVGNLTVGSIHAGVAGTYMDGYVSEARIWSTARTQTQVQDNMGLNLVGSETGLIALYKGNGVFTDATTNANTLTASGGAIATAAVNPYSLYEYGIITSVTYSAPNTQFTVFGGTDYTIPNATLAGVYYSSARAPYGFPANKNKWIAEEIYRQDIQTNIGVVATFYGSTASVSVPTGEWTIGCQGNFESASNVSGSRSFFARLAPATPTPAFNVNDIQIMRGYLQTATNTTHWYFRNDYPITMTSQARQYVYGGIDTTPQSGENWKIRAAQGAVRLYAECAYV